MERIKDLGRYQKGVLLFMTAMVLVFAAVYPRVIARRGFLYENAILVPRVENGNAVYSGKIQGKQARFTVYADKTVEFQYGDRAYGPYTAKEDPTAIPKDNELGESMTGVEVRRGEEILFRGGMLEQGDFRFLYNEDGSLENMGFTMTTEYGVEIDKDGNIIDSMEPSVSALLDLMAGPELAHKGDWEAWLGGAVICLVAAISILFADELFRLDLAFRIRNADRAEPSDWEIAGRYLTWTILPIAALFVFVVGLQ